MEIALNTPSKKIMVLGMGVLFSATYMALGARTFLAWIFAGKPDLSSLQRAIRLDAGDADYRDRLGRYYAFVARDPSRASRQYREAVKLDPHSARYWFDLATSSQISGDAPTQTWALEHAIEADPTTPDVAWEAANFYLVQGENDKALREFRIVLENDPSLAPLAIEYCWRIDPDVDKLLNNVVPAKSDAYIAFLNLLMSRQETAATKKVWAALMANSEPFEMRYVYAYFQFLLNHREVDQARLVWLQSASRFGLSSYLPTRNNLIVNGDFRLDVLNGGFDWQYEKQSSVTLTLDPSEFHGGHRSLLIAFDGPGVTDAGIRQFVAVQPETAYQFSAYYKNGELEGAGGPHFTIEDAYARTILYDSDELKEPGFWKSAAGEFTTPADCKLLLLHVRRVPAGSPIRGKIWVDDFRLVLKP
jgi:Carbohydrate binding domain